MEEINLLNAVTGQDVTELLSEEELLTIQVKLWQLLAKRTRKYTMGDSTSVPVETAQELMTSLCFTLEQYLKESGQSPKLLVSAELDQLFNLGQKIIETKMETGRQLWKTAGLGAPKIANISFQDTLRSIGSFFKRYDYRFFAHQIPCSLDYQLCHAVQGSKLGIEYINEYLRRMIIENNFLRHYETALVIRLLESYCPDYQGLLINLCEPVLVNAVGLTLLGNNPLSLEITDNARIQLAALFEQMPKDQALFGIREAALRLCSLLGIADSASREYLARTAEETYPRIRAALPAGN
ncbi:MAG: DUF6179 domain-containing protein, partial [Clostridia bacterium]|nr:DUF6179 domain-containing protein [Clostridia bacterium]